MDWRAVACWVKEALSKPEAPGWAQAIILVITGIIVWKYTKESQKLREEAQKQTELQLRPFVILEATQDHLHVRNVGNGPAFNVRVPDFELNENNVISVLPVAIPILLGQESLELPNEVLVNDEMISGDLASQWLSRLRPLPLQGDLNDFHPQITLEFENLERQRYFVKESLRNGRLRILDSGKAQTIS